MVNLDNNRIELTQLINQQLQINENYDEEKILVAKAYKVPN